MRMTWFFMEFALDKLYAELGRRNQLRYKANVVARAWYIQSGAPGFFARRLLEPSIAEHIGSFLTPLISAPHLLPPSDTPFPSELRLHQPRREKRKQNDDDETDSSKRQHL